LVIVLAIFRNVFIDATLFGIATGRLTGSVVVTDNIIYIDTTNCWMTIISGTSVIVVTFNVFIFTRRITGSFRIARICSTHIVIVTIYSFRNTSLVLTTVNSSTRVIGFTNVRFIITSRIIIAEINSTRVRIITVNCVVSTSS